MRPIPFAILSLTLLSACGGGDTSGGKRATVPEQVRKADPVIMAERRSAGRWRSERGVLPGDKSLWVIIDISGTKDLRVEKRGLSGRMEQIYAQASGKVTVSPDGVAAEAPDADGTLLPFRSFTASFPSAAKMLVKSGDQSFLFTYDGA